MESSFVMHHLTSVYMWSHSSSDALQTKTPHICTRKLIRYETRTPHVYTRQVMHYERRLHTFALVKSYIMNEDSTCIYSSSHTLRTRTTHTRKIIHYERGLPHVCTSKVIHYEQGLHMYTHQVMHNERGLHIHS